MTRFAPSAGRRRRGVVGHPAHEPVFAILGSVPATNGDSAIEIYVSIGPLTPSSAAPKLAPTSCATNLVANKSSGLAPAEIRINPRM